MEKQKNIENKGISTKRKIGKVTYEVIVHFNENATETMADKLKRIMLREMQREKERKND
ncbi:transposon-encoded TnpW family protein [Pasteurella testudinis]|uniref:transposon-encoded TnpW family protein n=1 Tax=Pasteurella testudinis TaxID=761 RepID=UPI0040594546